MNSFQVLSGFLIIVTIVTAGCTIPGSHVPKADGQPPGIGTGHPQPTGTPAADIPTRNVSSHPTVTASGIPLLLTDTDWQMAEGCGWTGQDISVTTALLTNSCEVRNLLADGWQIKGLGYDMNFLGSRCRMSTHPDASGSCDWCLDSGPTLVLQYSSLTTEFLVNMKDKTVTRFRTDLPEDATSISTGDADIIRLRNGTVLYTFRKC
jgi:hypothetical protein